MAQTLLVEYTEEKELKRKLRDLSFVMMGKSQKFSKGYNSGFVPDYRHTVETMGDSEGFDYSGGVDCEDFCAPKRKCISLNEDRLDVCSVPTQVISLSKLSATQRKELQMRFTEELQQVQAVHKRILSMSVKGGNAISVSSINQGHSNKKDLAVQNGANLKRGVTGRFVSAKRAPAIPPVTNSHAMLMKQCEMILKRVMSHQYGWVFNTPVDVVKLNIPDYNTIIKHPMDLGTVKSKIASGAYTTPWDFAADVRLTFTNAMTYNPPGNDVHAMADTMSKFFETRWKPFEKKLVAADIRDKKQEETKPVQLQKNKKASPMRHKTFDPAIAKPKMTDEEKVSLGRRVESLLSNMPEHIVEFLRRHCDPSNQSCEDGVEIDFATLSDDTLFELRQLLDDDLRKKQTSQPTIAKPCEMDMLNEYGTGNSPMDHHPFKGMEPADEDIDIGGNDPPIPCYPPVEIEKDTALKSSKCSSSSSSSSDSDSSSDSGSSSGSESDAEVASPPKIAKEHVQQESVISKGKRDMHSLDVNRSVGGLDQFEQDTHPITVSVDMNGNNEGENAPCERQVSPDKLYRAALLRSRFADTILRAREKALDQGEKRDPEKLRREKEELERQQREEKARLQAEAKAAEEVRRRAEAEAAAEAAAEAKRKRELEREAARQALLKIEKTVEINENSLIFHDLEMLRTAPAENAPESSAHETSPDISPDGMFNLGGGNALEQLGLYIKPDDEEEEEGEPGNSPMHDNNPEEGEID